MQSCYPTTDFGLIMKRNYQASIFGSTVKWLVKRQGNKLVSFYEWGKKKKVSFDILVFL